MYPLPKVINLIDKGYMSNWHSGSLEWILLESLPVLSRSILIKLLWLEYDSK